MTHRWEYLQLDGAPDLPALGKDGWELVSIQQDRWIFKRPEPHAAERFTLEQRDAALADVEGHAALTRHLLNPEVAALIRRVNHTQMLLIADRGFPVPDLRHGIDLSLTADIPTIPQVLAAIRQDLPMDRLIVAEEQQIASPTRWNEHQQSAPRVEAVKHLEFKHLAAQAVGYIRTGDSTPYGNVLVVGG